MKNEYFQLVPADVSFAEQVLDYYKRNKVFLETFEPVRDESFFSLEYQKKALRREMLEYKEKTSFRFYIMQAKQPFQIIGVIGLNNVIWGAFCSSFLGYKLDKDFLSQIFLRSSARTLAERKEIISGESFFIGSKESLLNRLISQV